MMKRAKVYTGIFRGIRNGEKNCVIGIVSEGIKIRFYPFSSDTFPIFHDLEERAHDIARGEEWSHFSANKNEIQVLDEFHFELLKT